MRSLMKDKKTGEIVVFSGFGVTVVGEDGKTRTEIFDSLAELNERWEDYKEPKEEPKEYWYIDLHNEVRCCYDTGSELDEARKEIGNYFETKEETEKAVEKLIGNIHENAELLYEGAENDKLAVDVGDLRLMVNSSLRYALGRATYITGATADFLQALDKSVWDERTLSVAIMDLERYFEDRENGYKTDMDCDLAVWKSLYVYLKEVRKEDKND